METIYIQPLGQILQEASLISPAQIEVALYDRSCYQDLRLGEILALRGWIEQETADFFADCWNDLIDKHKQRYPLGYYLQQAGLLSDVQIKSVLEEQNLIWMRFGSIAVLKGWLKQGTLDFFLRNLFPEFVNASPFIGKKNNLDAKKGDRDNETLLTENTEEIDYEDIPWID